MICLLSLDQLKWAETNLKAKKVKSLIEESASHILHHLKLSEILERAEVSILISNDKAIRKLNKQYRGKDKPTNVLSFPYMDFKNGKLKGSKKQSLYGSIGDIILSYETCAREAKEQSKELYSHITHLIIHSILHLLGFDHENEKDAKIMESLEIKLLKNFNIKNPYL